MRVYCCQHDIAWENKSANHARVRALLDAVAPEAGSLVLLPEMFATGFSPDVAKIAEEPPGPTTLFLSETARELGIFLLGGLVTRRTDGRGLNQAPLFDPTGREVMRYTKLHPFTAGGEAARFAPGEKPLTFVCGPVTVAPFICYDLRFPEVFRHAARSGAQLFAVIASWPTSRQDHWVALLRARAIENQAYVAGVNRCGTDPKLTYSGSSMIVNPRGQVIAQAGSGEQVIAADLDLPALVAYRREFPALSDMRREFFLPPV